MKYLAAYCLAALGGAENPGAQVKAILESVGITVNEDDLNTVLTAMEGK